MNWVYMTYYSELNTCTSYQSLKGKTDGDGGVNDQIQ